MTHFYRACPRHRDELREDPSLDGRERLLCPQGHHVDAWIVVSEDGTRVGKCWANRPEMVVGEIEELPEPKRRGAPARRIPPGKPPYRPCINGHTDWFQTSQGKWACRICRRGAWKRQNERRSAEKRKAKK